MKVSIFMPVYKKNYALPAVLYSLRLQKVDFEYQLCVIDDCCPEKPWTIIKEYFPNAKYKRLDRHHSFDTVMGFCFDFVPKETEIIIMMSADVVCSNENVLQTLYNNCLPNQAAFATVANASKQLTEACSEIFFRLADTKEFYNWLSLVNKDWNTTPPQIRSGKTAYQDYFFLGAIRKEDMEVFDNIKKPWCDVMLHYNIANYGIKCFYPENTFGIHLWHEPTLLKCANMDTCNYICKLKKHFTGEWR